MAECTQWFNAEDAKGKPLPFTARFKFYELKGGEFVDSGLYGVLPGSPFAMKVDSSKKYKVVPLDEVIQGGKLVTLSGWIIPSAETFNGCAIDIKFVYKKVICTPNATKCVGDAVHKCSNDGTEWEFSKNCPGGCKNGECVAVPVRKPEITSIYTKETPELCVPLQFESRVDYNDAGWKKTDQGTGLRRAWWEYSRDDSEWDSECAKELSWTQFSDESWPLHTFIEEHADIRHIRHTIENMFGERACEIISNFRFADSSGFVITVDESLAGKKMIVYHVTPIVGTDLYYFPFSYVGGEWNSIDSKKVYNVPVGNIATAPSPAFDKKLNTGSFADGIDCVILVESSSMIGFSIFKKDDVFKLRSNEPTCVGLKTTSEDVITETVMGPVCDLFGIPRDTKTEKLCTAFWSEFADPVFIANYASILKTGKDTLGNTRELTAFDHLALPFAILGVVAPQLPFGKFVSEGLKGLWKGGKIFSDAAFNWMETVAINTPADKIVSEGPWTFMQSIVRISGEHLDEVMELIHKNDFVTAASKLEKYLASDLGNVPYRVFTDFNDALRQYLPMDQWEFLMDTIYGYAPQADSIIKTASKASQTADDLANIADASKLVGVMDEVTAAVYNSLKTIGDITPPAKQLEKLNKLKNVLKNSPTLSAKLVDKHLSILDNVLYKGGDITKAEIDAIFIHGMADPNAIGGDMVYDLTISEYFDDAGVSIGTELYELIRRLDDGTYRQVLADSFLMVDDSINQLGGKLDMSLVEDYCMIGRSALKDAAPAVVSGIVKGVQEVTAETGKIIDDVCGVR